jgi:predicted DNA-binding WGR domain protein
MLTLYKRTSRGTLFWQVWRDSGQLAINEGKVGSRGKARLVRPPRGTALKQFQNSLEKEKRAEGYAEVSDNAHHWIVVQYKLKTWGSPKDLDKAEKLEFLFNECLGWTGNGHCDGNDIGSGEMNVFCVVLDPKLGAKTIVAELKSRPRLLAGAVVAVREGEDYRVVHPPRYRGEFSVA